MTNNCYIFSGLFLRNSFNELILSFNSSIVSSLSSLQEISSLFVIFEKSILGYNGFNISISELRLQVCNPPGYSFKKSSDNIGILVSEKILYVVCKHLYNDDVKTNSISVNKLQFFKSLDCLCPS